MGIDDELLDNFAKPQRTHILCAYEATCRRNKCGKSNKKLLTGNTIKATITHVRSTFRSNLRSDPALNVDDKSSTFLKRQLEGYADTDAPPKYQKALPLSVFHALHDNIFTPLDEAMGKLACGAFSLGYVVAGISQYRAHEKPSVLNSGTHVFSSATYRYLINVAP